MKCFKVYEFLFGARAREVVETRAYDLKKSNSAWEGWAGGAGIVYGYFDNPEAFGRAAGALEKAKTPDIYFSLNLVNPGLLARAANQLKAADMKTSTISNKDIRCIRWPSIDLDPQRPSRIFSTATELKKAISLRNKIWKWIQPPRVHKSKQMPYHPPGTDSKYARPESGCRHPWSYWPISSGRSCVRPWEMNYSRTLKK